MSSTDERLSRLLALVPYFEAHPGVLASDAAEDFGITEKQLRKDLDLLWVCGLPGGGPGDLIDLSFEGATISVLFNAGIRRPLKLTAAEALALVVALRTLSETPGIADTDAIQRALAKVEAAAGGDVDDTTVAVELDVTARLLPALHRAVDESRALSLRYYTATRDETTERVVDPLRVFEVDGHSYLEAWCRSAEGMRIFRVDRIEHVDVLAEASAPPADVELRDLKDGVYQPASEHLLALLRVSGSYAWVADYYPTESVVETDDGLEVSLRVAQPAWVRAMALGSAGDVQVLSPLWLAESVRAEAAAALSSYSGA